MQTVDASVILADAYHLIGWDADQLEDRQKQQARAAFSMALQEVWESWWWQELMKSTKVQPHANWSATEDYDIGDIVYDVATKKYFVRLVKGVVVAMVNDTNETEAAGTYIWDGTNYTQYSDTEENQRRIESAGGGAWSLFGHAQSAPSGLDECYRNDSSLYGYYYRTYDGTELQAIRVSILATAPSTDGEENSDVWAELAWDVTAPNWEPLTDYVAGDKVLNLEDNLIYQCIYPHTSTTAFDETMFSELEPFEFAIEVSGDVRGIGKHDLRNSPNGFAYDFEKTLDGYRIPGWDTDVPWVWYRRPVPIITGDDYSSTATYTAAETITFD